MSMELLKAITASTRSPDEADGRVYGWIPGIVTDVHPSRPEVKARIGKQGDNESAGWLVQIGGGGIEALPNVGDPIGVLFHDGDPNRGAFFYYPQSNTKNRPSDYMMLGSTFIALYNDLAAKFNRLLAAYKIHTHIYAAGPLPGTAGVPTVDGLVTDAPAGSALAADGTQPSSATSAVCVSGRAKVGK